MKRHLIITAYVLAFSLSVSAKTDVEHMQSHEWRIAEVEQIMEFQTFPPSYGLQYTTYCGDVNAKGIRFVSDDELVLGVAVRKSLSIRCVHPNPQKKIVSLSGKKDDPQTITTLTPRLH